MPAGRWPAGWRSAPETPKPGRQLGRKLKATGDQDETASTWTCRLLKQIVISSKHVSVTNNPNQLTTRGGKPNRTKNPEGRKPFIPGPNQSPQLFGCGHTTRPQRILQCLVDGLQEEKRKLLQIFYNVNTPHDPRLRHFVPDLSKDRCVGMVK